MGKDVHDIMPEYMAVPHKKMIKKWIDEENVSDNMGIIKDVYYVGKSFSCFNGGVYLKINAANIKLKIYIIIVK